MADIFGVTIASRLFFYMMVSFAFFIGVILMVSPEAFESLNRALQKEYGLKKRIIPKLEDTANYSVDNFILRNRVIAGLLISIASFILILAFQV